MQRWVTVGFAVAFGALGVARAGELNRRVLGAIGSMPSGGGYATGAAAFAGLRGATEGGGARIELEPARAVPSFCSGATYLVLLEVLSGLEGEGRIGLPAEAWRALRVKAQPDGSGVWGRWNANGPGAARLFHELGAGRSFEDRSRAVPGDFLKIFWTDEIGKHERGHLVVYLGSEGEGAEGRVRFWSSNKPGGYGEKAVPWAKVKRAVFTRLEEPAAFARVTALPARDRYLADMLVRPGTVEELRARCGIGAGALR